MGKSFTNWISLRQGLLNISVLLIFVAFAEGQDANAKWTALASPKGDLTISMPGNLSVQNESELIRVFAVKGGATIDLQVRPNWNPKDNLKYSGREFDDSGTVELRDFKIGKVDGRARVRNAGQYSISIYVAGKAFYQITAGADGPNNPVLKEFLASIRVDGQPLMKDAGPPPTDPVRINTLATTADVREALNVPDADKISVTYDSAVTLDTLNPGGPYSRMPLILRKARATYTDAARQGNVQGDVVLFVQLKADGSVGNVTVRKTLPKGLADNAVQAAKRIKFIPAQRNGQNVDSYVAMTYSFAIY